MRVRCQKKLTGSKLFRREDGSLTVELIILLPLLLLIISGIVEFGHLMYVRHAITNASREGARAAVVFNPVADRATWAQGRADQTVRDYLGFNGGSFALLPGVQTVNVNVVPGAGSGDPLTVTVTASDFMLVLSAFIPQFQTVSVAAETTMIME